MSVRDHAPMGAPIWIDLMTSDTDGARAFYGQLLGWECEDPNPEFGGYANFTLDGKPVAGLMAKMEESMPDVWGIYLEVTDAEKTVAAVTEKGLPVIVPAMKVGEFGTMAVVVDPTGAAIGMWQPDQHKGFVYMEPNAPGWCELHTRDLPAAVGFYEDVFGWRTRMESDTPEMRYATQVDDESMWAGVMDASAFLPEGVPAHWSVYIQVDDADAVIDRAVGLGGSVVMPAEDTPYGRLAVLADPTGAIFKLRG
jgi:predicted enzyme related to lactoylglutathione lyase